MTKKSFGLREWIILAAVALSVYSIIPSIQYHTKQGTEKVAFAKENPNIVNKSVKFGLDLAGGTSITLEIDKSGLKSDEASDVQARSLAIIRNRIDQYGLSEPQIFKVGDNRIVAELAGVDEENARKLVGETAILEFRLVAEQEKAKQLVTSIDNYLKERTSRQAKPDTLPETGKDTSAAVGTIGEGEEDEDRQSLAGGKTGEILSDTDTVDVLDPERPFTGYMELYGNDLAVPEKYKSRVDTILAMPEVQAIISSSKVNFAWGYGYEEKGSERLRMLYLLKGGKAEMDGKEIADARASRASDGLSAGQARVELSFKGDGPKRFDRITASNINRQMAIVLDGQVVSAPFIRARISNGRAEITGLKDMTEATQVAIFLRAGALPAPMKPIDVRSIGASLGAENIKAGFGSALVGFVICLLFMIFYYNFAGLVANAGIFVNMLIIGAVLSLFNATLTLPGIAGMILTAAMALDANIIIYERIREELRAGQMARMAVSKGYEKAFSAILDSNVTTFLVAFILYKIGTGPVKGFGLTLMVGISASLFSALTVTRAIFDLKLSKHDVKTVNIGNGIKWLQEARFQIVSKRGIWAKLSITVCAVCIGLAIIKGFDYSIDFTGGLVYTVEYTDDSHHVEKLNDVLGKEEFGDVTVRKLGGTSLNQYMLSIQTEKTDEEAVKALTEKLNTALANAGAPRIVAEDVVGPTIGGELRFNAILAIILSWLGIGIYIWARFGKMGLGFGAGSIITLVHDSIICLGVISLFRLPVDGAMIAAFLTMIGYSINDTIVIYDRIRENKLLAKETLEERINISINQSFSRTIITSLSTLFVCVVLSIMGGSSIRDFGIVMSAGIVVGTYSSICISAPFLIWWSKKFKKGMG